MVKPRSKANAQRLLQLRKKKQVQSSNKPDERNVTAVDPEMLQKLRHAAKRRASESARKEEAGEQELRQETKAQYTGCINWTKKGLSPVIVNPISGSSLAFGQENQFEDKSGESYAGLDVDMLSDRSAVLYANGEDLDGLIKHGLILWQDREGKKRIGNVNAPVRPIIVEQNPPVLEYRANAVESAEWRHPVDVTMNSFSSATRRMLHTSIPASRLERLQKEIGRQFW